MTLAWDANPGSGASGYYIYYGTTSWNYTSRINAGSATSYVVPNLVGGQRYYFAVTAYTPQQESSYSGEVVATAPSQPPTSTSLTTSSNPSVVGTTVTLIATVTGTAPSGTVTFRDGVTPIPGCGSVTLGGSGNVRTAACSTAGLAVGARVIAASYNGSATAAPSGSLTQTQYVHATATPSTFADVPADHWAFPAAEALAYNSISLGCASNPQRFCPDELVNRDELAVLLLRARFGAAYNPPGATGTMFADVPAGLWAADWIEDIYRLGYTSGCTASPRNFCPSQPVTRIAMAVFLQRAFNLVAR